MQVVASPAALFSYCFIESRKSSISRAGSAVVQKVPAIIISVQH